MKDPCLLCLSTIPSGWKERELSSLLPLIQSQNYSNFKVSNDLINAPQSKFVTCSQCEFFISSAFKLYNQICALNVSLKNEIENIRTQILGSQQKSVPQNVLRMRKTLLQLSETIPNQITNQNEGIYPSSISAEEIHVKIEKLEEDSVLESEQHQTIEENEPNCILPISEEEIKIKLEGFEEDSNPSLDFEPGPSSPSKFLLHLEQDEEMEMEMEFEDAEPFNFDEESEDYDPISSANEVPKAKKRKATSSEQISNKKSKSGSCEESKEDELDAFWAKYPKPFKMKWGYLYPCPICSNTKFTSKSKLINHMFKKHETEDKPLSCDKCEKKFTLELNYERHVHLHQFEDRYPFVCDICDTRFGDQDRFNSHVETHTKKKGEYPCEHCGKIFYAPHHLRVHLRIHTGERPLKCQYCPESFIDASRRKVHYDKVHNNNQKFPCTLCNAVLATSAGLKKHLNIHEGKGCFSGSKCDVEGCGQVFKHQKTLLSHQIKVHGMGGFVCDECGTTLATKYGLKEHKRSHTGLKQFKCDICPAEFMRKTSLKAHLAKHEEEKEQKGI